MTALLVWGCSPKNQSKIAATRAFGDQNLSLEIRCDQTEISTAELLYVTLLAEAPQGNEFQFLEEDFDFGDFTLFESHLSSLTLNSKLQVTQSLSLVLEPNLAGTYTLPALPVSTGTVNVSSEPISVDVKSVLQSGEKELRPQASFDSVEYSIWLVPTICIVAVLLFAFILLLKPREKVERSLLQISQEKIKNISGLAELPQVITDYLSARFQKEISYTGADSVLRYLAARQLPEKVISEVEQVFSRYEEARFSVSSAGNLEALKSDFSQVLVALEAAV
jgi:hypothetical protein